MTKKTGLDRRSFLAANAAVAAVAVVPAAATASTPAAPSAVKRLGWDTVTGDDLAGMIGERFRVRSDEAGELVLKLVAVEPVESGPARPADLVRTEGVVAVFDSPDKAPVVDCGCGIYRVSHARLGAADLYMGPSPLRRGGHVVELVLN